MTPYLQSLTDVMARLATEQDALFIGQSIVAGGTVAHRTFAGVPAEQLIEMPVFEETQCGIAIGLALADPSRPVLCFYPRINFLLLAMNQLVNHLDKMHLYAGVNPRVIIRTAVAHDRPLDPGPQHTGNYVVGLRGLCRNIPIIAPRSASDVALAYEFAGGRPGPTIIVEHMELYFDD
jgi:pyruvate/2-oxoglutarate/acetoin dehydrogenase E1 component